MLTRGLFLLLIPFFIQYANAGVIVGGTRLIYNADKKEVSLSVKNPDANTDYLIQSWLDHGQDGAEGKIPFVITPPLQRLNAGDETLLRIINTGSLPQDRESQYWLSVKSISAIDETVQNRLQITVRTRIKMIYRPAALSAGAADAYTKLAFSRQGSSLQVSNPTPYFVSLQSVKVGGKAIREPGMVEPFGKLSLPLPAGASGTVVWQAINDYGSPTKEAVQQ